MNLPTYPRERQLEDLVTAKIQGYTQLRVARTGSLSAPEDGQAPGTPFVVIQADNAMNRDIAKDRLRDHFGTTDLAWECGWTMRPSSRRWNGHASELTLYPAFLTNQDPSGDCHV